MIDRERCRRESTHIVPGIFAYHNQKDPSRRNLERLSQSTLLTLTTTWKQYSRQLYLLESSFECITMILSNEYPLPGDASCFLKQRTLCFEVSTMVQHECECVWVVRGIDAAWNFYKHISSNGLVHLQSEQPAVVSRNERPLAIRPSMLEHDQRTLRWAPTLSLLVDRTCGL